MSCVACPYLLPNLRYLKRGLLLSRIEICLVMWSWVHTDGELDEVVETIGVVSGLGSRKVGRQG